MDCTKPHLLALAGLLLLLAALGFATASAAPSEVSPQQRFRYVAWDCSDWSMITGFGDDRGRAILEMLALNRGMTLYCGAEQSNILTKAELWEVGQEHNERDDTVYWGEGGSFRGFTAPQEGWLTDGASGITGISLHRIFEFPREERKRRARRDSRSALIPISDDGSEPQESGYYFWHRDDAFVYPRESSRTDCAAADQVGGACLNKAEFNSLAQIEFGSEERDEAGLTGKDAALAAIYSLSDPEARRNTRSSCRDLPTGDEVPSLSGAQVYRLNHVSTYNHAPPEGVNDLLKLEDGYWTWHSPVQVHYQVWCRARVVSR